VLGPYSGKLHFGSKTLLEEIAEKGHKPVNSYAFSSFSNDGTISAHVSGNILSLINSHKEGLKYPPIFEALAA
jgi:hypothetical protein